MRKAFMRVLRSNHQAQMIKTMRLSAGNDRDRWLKARGHLRAVGFDPVLVDAVDFAHGLLMLEVAPPRNLVPESLCLADLPLVARGARRVAVLAEAELGDFVAGTALLAALQNTRAELLVVCPPELAPLLAGFRLLLIDRELFLKDDPYMEAQTKAMRDFAPDLLVNLDRRRGITGDLLAEAARAPGMLGFDNETPDNRNDPARLRRSRFYRQLLPRDAPAQAPLDALGLEPAAERLWLDPAAQARARALLDPAWDPARTLAVLGDDPSALAGPGALELEQAARDGWSAVGLGGPGTVPVLAEALKPFGARARNLGGSLALADMAAVVQVCGAFCAGSPLFQALAKAAG
jgi:hypothetical protein